MFILLFLNPVLFLLAITGLAAGMIIVFFFRAFPFVPTALIMALIGVVLLSLYFQLNSPKGLRQYDLEPLEYREVPYKCHIKYKDNAFYIIDEFRVNSEEKKIVNKLTRNSKWNIAGLIGQKIIVQQHRIIPVRLALYSSSRIIAVQVPSMKIGKINYIPDINSSAMINVPKKMVVKTFPPYLKKTDNLAGNSEILIMSIKELPEGENTIRLKVVGNLYRNDLGNLIVQFSFWTPFRWLVFTMFFILSEQIKKDVLTPIADKLLQIIKLKSV